MHEKKEMKFKLSYEERRHKEDHILSNQPGPFTPSLSGFNNMSLTTIPKPQFFLTMQNSISIVRL